MIIRLNGKHRTAALATVSAIAASIATLYLTALFTSNANGFCEGKTQA